MDWISVKDRLPEKDIPVLIYDRPYIQVAEYWYDQDGTPIFYDPPHPPFERVTHWMPLPEAPREQLIKEKTSGI